MTTLVNQARMEHRLAGARHELLLSDRDSSPPPISEVLLTWFRWYARRHIRRHFHAVRIGGCYPVHTRAPLIGYANHASWWDPMLLFAVCNHIVPGRRHYAPIDACALNRYPLLKRLGLFGVEQGSQKGAVEFLRSSKSILACQDTALWLTPQGRFCDVRERPVKFSRGIGSLARRCEQARFLPVAVEYAFWEERLPEMLVWIGNPVEGGEVSRRSINECTLLLEDRLAALQDELSSVSIRRDTSRLTTVLRGGSGASAVYDAWRWTRSLILGERFQKDHGRL